MFLFVRPQGTNQDCIAAYSQAGEEWKCIFTQYVAPFIRSELFVMQTLYDGWQIDNILRIGCCGWNKPMSNCTAAQLAALQQFGADMRAARSHLSLRAPLSGRSCRRASRTSGA